MRAAADKESELLRRLEAGAPEPAPRPRGVTVRLLVDKHLAWVKSNRSPALHKQRSSLLNGLCGYVLTGQVRGSGEAVGDLLAGVVERSHIEAYIASKSLGPVSLRAISVAVKATWNWASANGLLAEGHRPLAALPRGRVPVRDLSEADLPTPAEVDAIFRWSTVATSKVRAGTGRWRKRRPDEYYDAPEARTFGDMVKVYHATGARTGELCELTVRDFMPSTRQLCLGKHKRSGTQANATVRNIQLGDEALAVVLRNVADKAPSTPLFARSDGKAWTQEDVNRRFRGVRGIAKDHAQPVRAHITPYSFRHLYISELLTLGTPIFQVAKMAGTSPREIERTYGHFFNADLAMAQRKLDRKRAKRTGEAKGESHPHRAKD